MLYERSFGQLHYWFAYDETLFVALDTSGKGIREDELVWLDRTLSLHRPQYRTCIVFTHVPPHNPQAGGGHDLGKGGDRLMAVLEKWNVTALFASHVHSYAEESIRGVPVYITGGGGADLDHPDDTFHYLLCRIDSDGKLTVTKEDVPTLPNHDYLEYVARAKWGREALRGLSAGLLFIGLCAGWLTRRRAKHANAGSEAAKDGANPGGPRC
jgi:hypothetical protein